MEINEKGLPIHRDATAKVRPRIFLEGNYFVDLKPGTPSRADAEGRRDDPGAADRRAGAVRPVPRDAAERHARGPAHACCRSTARRSTARAAAASTARSSTGSPRSRTRRSSTTRRAACSSTTCRTTSTARAASPRASTATPSALKSLITDFAATADAFADEQDNLSARDRRAADARCATASRAFGALRRRVPAGPPLRAATLAPTVRSSGPRSTRRCPFVKQLRGLVSRPSCRASSRDLRPTVPDARRAQPRRRRASRSRRALLGSCNNNVITPWNEDDDPRPELQAGRARSTRRRSKQFVGLAAESRIFDANGQYVRSLRATTRNYAYRARRRALLLHRPAGAGRQPAAKTDGPPALPARRAVRDPGAPGPAHEGPARRRSRSAINQNAPGAAERRAKADETLMDWMERRAEARAAWTSSYKLSDEPLKARRARRRQARRWRRRGDEARDPRPTPRTSSRSSRCLAVALLVACYILAEPAAAHPVPRAQAVRAEGRVLDRAGGHAGPGPDGPRRRRAHRRHRQGRARRTAARS